jgi:hypothetical protein
VNDVRDTCEPDGAADRAASAARTLAAIAHDAARKHVKRDVVTPQTDGSDSLMVPSYPDDYPLVYVDGVPIRVDTIERERQARLRRWQTPPLSNRKGG